jgi:hypothetical protein
VALGSRQMDLRNGWFDSSGDEGSFVRPWALDLPALQGCQSEPCEIQAMAACRYWALDRHQDPERPAVIVDVVSGDLWLHGQPAGNLVDKYKGGAGVRGLAWMIEEWLGPPSGRTPRESTMSCSARQPPTLASLRPGTLERHR